MPQINDQFHRELDRVVVEKLDNQMVQLAQGAAPTYEGYREIVGYLRALSDVRQWCDDLEAQMYGRREVG